MWQRVQVISVKGQENGSSSLSFLHLTGSLSHLVLEKLWRASTISLLSLEFTQHDNQWSMNSMYYFKGKRIRLHRWNWSLQSPLSGAKGPLDKGKDFPGLQPPSQDAPASQSLYSLSVISIKEIKFPLKTDPMEKDFMWMCACEGQERYKRRAENVILVVCCSRWHTAI